MSDRTPAVRQQDMTQTEQREARDVSGQTKTRSFQRLPGILESSGLRHHVASDESIPLDRSNSVLIVHMDSSQLRPF